MKHRLHITLLLVALLISTPMMAHKAGELYQGGIIFWVNATGDHGLIAAAEDQHYQLSTCDRYFVSWAANTSVVGANQDGIFSGSYNTARMLEAVPTNIDTRDIAGSMAASYTGGEYGDWYLPSKYELNLMYERRCILGMWCQRYWSSSEAGQALPRAAWSQLFASEHGEQVAGAKNEPNSCVRAIRGF